MLAGIPREYHISCRVRSSLEGIDEEPHEYAGYTVGAATPMLALSFWLAGESYKEKAWLRCSNDDLQRLLGLPKNEHIDFSTTALVEGNGDWDVGLIEFDDGAHVVEMHGTANLSEFKFEIRISPVSKQEIARIPKDLSRTELEEIADYAQQLFKDDGVLTCDKEWNGADFIDHMTEVLTKHGMVPIEVRVTKSYHNRFSHEDKILYGTFLSGLSSEEVSKQIGSAKIGTIDSRITWDDGFEEGNGWDYVDYSLAVVVVEEIS